MSIVAGMPPIGRQGMPRKNHGVNKKNIVKAGKVLDYAEKAPFVGGEVTKVRNKARGVIKRVNDARVSFRKAYRSDAAKTAGQLLDHAEKIPKFGKTIKKYRDKARKVLKKI